MKNETGKSQKKVSLKKKLLSSDLDVPAAGASFAKAVWTWHA
ncbi:MAG: hypothetical protein QOH04_1008 [Sphingomonadales bacterium]|jgi:hypothetical protein|nr:hypothetical protein [Sphingomonadales bacterium]MEA3035249.1 hypothetical protein [Sphingomonadales bacterium]